MSHLQDDGRIFVPIIEHPAEGPLIMEAGPYLTTLDAAIEAAKHRTAMRWQVAELVAVTHRSAGNPLLMVDIVRARIVMRGTQMLARTA